MPLTRDVGDNGRCGSAVNVMRKRNASLRGRAWEGAIAAAGNFGEMKLGGQQWSPVMSV